MNRGCRDKRLCKSVLRTAPVAAVELVEHYEIIENLSGEKTDCVVLAAMNPGISD